MKAQVKGIADEDALVRACPWQDPTELHMFGVELQVTLKQQKYYASLWCVLPRHLPRASTFSTYSK